MALSDLLINTGQRPAPTTGIPGQSRGGGGLTGILQALAQPQMQQKLGAMGHAYGSRMPVGTGIGGRFAAYQDTLGGMKQQALKTKLGQFELESAEKERERQEKLRKERQQGVEQFAKQYRQDTGKELSPLVRSILANGTQSDVVGAMKLLQEETQPEQPDFLNITPGRAKGIASTLAQRILSGEATQEDVQTFATAVTSGRAPITIRDPVTNRVLGQTDAWPLTESMRRATEIVGIAVDQPVEGDAPVEPEGGDETRTFLDSMPKAWDLAGDVTGVTAGLRRAASKLPLGLGDIAESDVENQAATYINRLRESAARAFQESPRFAQGEWSQILETLNGVTPQVMNSKSRFRSTLTGLDRRLMQLEDLSRRQFNNPYLDESERRRAASMIMRINQLRDDLGVPKEAHITGEVEPESDKEREALERYGG